MVLPVNAGLLFAPAQRLDGPHVAAGAGVAPSSSVNPSTVYGWHRRLQGPAFRCCSAKRSCRVLTAIVAPLLYGGNGQAPRGRRSRLRRPRSAIAARSSPTMGMAMTASPAEPGQGEEPCRPVRRLPRPSATAACFTAVMPSRRLSPGLMPASNPSSTMSTRRSVATISSSKLGLFETNARITGANMKAAMELGALMRTLPKGVSRNWFNPSSAEPISPKAGCANSFAPGSVSENAARGAVEQAHADPRLQVADRVAHRRRRHAALLAGATETAMSSDRIESRQFGQIGCPHS